MFACIDVMYRSNRSFNIPPGQPPGHLTCLKIIVQIPHYPAVVLTHEMSEVSAILVFTTKTTQPRPQVFSVNGALTCRGLHFLRHFLVKHKILPNLVISNWLW